MEIKKTKKSIATGSFFVTDEAKINKQKKFQVRQDPSSLEQRSYIEGLETNHVRHRRLYLRAREMLNSAIHTSTCVERDGFLEAKLENQLVCISLGEFAAVRYQRMRKNSCIK